MSIPNATWSAVNNVGGYDLPPHLPASRQVGASLPYKVALGPGSVTGRIDQVWHAVYWKMGNIYLIKMENGTWGAPVTLLAEASRPNRIALTFDQVGRPIVFYSIEPSTLKLYFYDSSVSNYTTTSIATGQYPVAGFDVPYNTSDSVSDAMIFYVRDDRLYMRVQRDRFLVEYDTGITHVGLKAYSCGRRTDNRFQVVYGYKPVV